MNKPKISLARSPSGRAFWTVVALECSVAYYLDAVAWCGAINGRGEVK